MNTHMWTLKLLKNNLHIHAFLFYSLGTDWAGLHCRVSYGLQRWAPDTGSAKGGGEQDLGKYTGMLKKIGFTVLVCILGNKVWFADMGNRVWNSKGGLET